MANMLRVRFGIAFTTQEWQRIMGALKFKAKRGKEMGLGTYVEEEERLADYIKLQLKKMN